MAGNAHDNTQDFLSTKMTVEQRDEVGREKTAKARVEDKTDHDDQIQQELGNQEEHQQHQEAVHENIVQDVHALDSQLNATITDLEKKIRLLQDNALKKYRELTVSFRILNVVVLLGSVIVAVMMYNLNHQLQTQKMKFEESSASFESNSISLEKCMWQELNKVFLKHEAQLVKHDEVNAQIDDKNDEVKSWIQKQFKKELEEVTANLRNKTDYLENQIHLRHNEVQTIEQKLLMFNESVNSQYMYDFEHKLEEFHNNTQHFSSFKNGFVMTEFSVKRSAGGVWTSPAMYTHVGGYKFVFHVYANGTRNYRNGIYVNFQVVAGEFDHNLQWPARVIFGAQIVGFRGSRSDPVFRFVVWEKPGTLFRTFWNIETCGSGPAVYFICHSDVNKYLVQDTLRFVSFTRVH